MLVLLGGSDLLRRMPERCVIDALQRCVDSARSSSDAVALISAPRFASGIANAPLDEAFGRAWDVPVL